MLNELIEEVKVNALETSIAIREGKSYNKFQNKIESICEEIKETIETELNVELNAVYEENDKIVLDFESQITKEDIEKLKMLITDFDKNIII